MTSQATRLLDAQTVLVGWINHSATDCYEHTRSSGDVVNLGTDLDATSSFVLVASHPGYSEAVTVTLELAPLLADGNAGSWITAAAVAIPAAGGKVEAIISGAALLINPADSALITPPCPLDTLNVAAGAEALPLELLQPLDSSNPASTPVRLSGPEQRPLVTPDLGVMGGDGDSSWLPPSQLLIGKDGATRSIWPVHLAGWQALGWQLLSLASGGDDPVPVDAGDNAPEPVVDPGQAPPEQEAPVTEPELMDALVLEPEQPEASEPAPATEETMPTGEPLESAATTTSEGEALLATEATDFQAMTKAQIVEFCSTTFDVELDGSQTKAELVEQATALEAQASGSSTATSDGTGVASSDPADLAALELGDALL